jgi:hypothetical protein
MRLTSSVKELEAILQKLIKFWTWIDPGWWQRKTWSLETGDADTNFDSGEKKKEWALYWFVDETKRNLFSQELEKWENEAVLNSVKLVKRKIQIS